MKKNILELAKQAKLKFSSEESLSPAEEKFAELIVKECADIATNRYQRLMDGGKAIKQHFGVE